jgi:dTDP-4-dehydrorhamnose reductase
MKILLLGRSGQVGSALWPLLAERFEVIATGRDEIDLSVPGAAADAIAQHRPDVVVNAAAWTAVDEAETSPERAERVNAAAVEEMARAVGGGLLVHYSTDYVFDGAGSSPFAETDPTAPLNAYGRSKRHGELAITESGCRHLIFRTSWVHAPGHRNFVATILRLAHEREQLRVVDDQIGAPTSADLIARTTLRALDRVAGGAEPESGIYHLAAAGETSWHGCARHIAEHAIALGAPLKCRPDRIEAIGSADYPQPAVRPRNSRLALGKIEQALSIAMPAWQDGVRDSVRLSLEGVTA